MIDLERAAHDSRPVHFVGIAGVGMSGLAELFTRRGVRVQGTDANPAGAADLARHGIAVSPHDAQLVHGAQAVVYSSAIPFDHPELVAARALSLPVIRRAEALGEAVRGGTVIGIAGTHGKTTTTVMTTEALRAAALDPTGIAGGRVGSWEGNLLAGSNTLFVVEADEYDRSFLALPATIGVALNMEADHLDIYRDLEDIRGAFQQFLAPARALVVCNDDAGARSLANGVECEVIRYGVHVEVPDTTTLGVAIPSDARMVARNLQLAGDGSRCELFFDGDARGELVLHVPGVHNVRNALAALSAGVLAGAAIADMLPGLALFRGVERRFERIGCAGDVLIIDDYAHHPTEVAATIAAARAAYPERRLVVAFQPHLYSRTRDFANAFASALTAADRCFLCDIYPAREKPISGVSSALIADQMQHAGRAPVWMGPRTACVDALRGDVKAGDIVVTMGAGDITRVGRDMFALLTA